MKPQDKLSFNERARRSWVLTKSSWRVLKLDKELLSIPAINSLIQVVVLVAIAAALLTTQTVRFSTSGVDSSVSWWVLGVAGVAIFLVISFISSLLAAAIIHGALVRFAGEDPTVKGSIAAAAGRWKPLLFFSVMMVFVTVLIEFLHEQTERLPIVGSFIAHLLLDITGLAWGVANFFSIAHIVSSDKEMMPLTATKSSVATIKKVWGEGITANLGLGILFGIGALLMTVSGIIGGVVALSIVGVSGAVTVGIGTLLLLLAVGVLFDALSSILTAALFHYAQTGESPETFDKSLLRSSMTRGKAQKVFGGMPKGGKTWA